MQQGGVGLWGDDDDDDDDDDKEEEEEGGEGWWWWLFWMAGTQIICEQNRPGNKNN